MQNANLYIKPNHSLLKTPNTTHYTPAGNNYPYGSPRGVQRKTELLPPCRSESPLRVRETSYGRGNFPPPVQMCFQAPPQIEGRLNPQTRLLQIPCNLHGYSEQKQE